MSRPFNRILITRMKYIGDVLLTTPVIRAVRAALPHAMIAYLGDSEAVTLLEHNPDLDEIIGFDFSRPTIVEQTRVALLLRRRRFDLVLDLFSNPRSALISYLSGAPVRVGLDRKGRGRLYTIRISDDGVVRTAIEHHLRFSAAIGIPPAAKETRIVVTTEEREKAAELLRECASRPVGHPLVGLHPGATWPAKRWIPERFGELAVRLERELGAQVIVTAGPREEEAVRLATGSLSRSPVVLPVVGLRMLAALISHCDAYVSNDAGPMHIGAAVGTPTIGLFGPGEENIWFPYAAARGHRALRKDVPCHPCHLDFCNRSGEGFMECMKLLSVGDVFEAVRAALQARSAGSLH